MAANGRGYMRPNSGGRTPSFLIIGLLVVITILAFNYWNVSSRNSELSMTMDEVQLKYRSTQAKKLDVERRNSELSAQLDDAKKYRQEAQEKAIRLREAEQKEKELIAKIDNLASEMEVVKSDLNTCDDEVGFCHENITKMIIAHKKALEEAQINCNMKIDAAKSNAEQRAASVESSCHQAVNEMRLMILRMVQEVFGTKAILLLQQQVHTDVSGIDLNKVTGPDVQMAQQPQQHNEHHIQQPAEEQQVVQNQQEQQHELQQPVQGQPQPVLGQQQPVQGQQQPAQSQQWPVQGQQEPGQGQQQPDLGQQQPDLGQQEPVQGQQQQVQGQQQPGQLQQQPVQEQQQQQLQEQDQNQLQQAVHEQQQPQVQQPQIQQPLHEQQQKQQEPQQQASNQDELPSEHLTEFREQHQGGLNEEKQVIAGGASEEAEKKEAIARSGLLQTDDLVKAAQRGYNQAVSERDVDVQSHVGNVQQHGYVTDNRELNDKPLQEHRADDNQAIINQAPVAQQGIEQKTFDQGVQTAVGQEMARNDGYRSENVAQREAFHHVATNEAAAAPAGQVMIEDGLNREHDNMAQSDRDNTRLDLGQRRDQADYLPAEIDRTAPIGQADESHVDVPQFHEYRDEKHQAVRDLQEDEEFIEHIPQQ